jgi:Type III restriction enzyme, res subunit
MIVRIPRTLRAALWRHQQEALDAMISYVAAFDISRPRAALVHMPTGSGKTAVIASLARCFESSGPVVVIAPRIGLREQLARDIGKRFFDHAGVDPASLPRRVVELRDGNSHPGNLKDVVLVTTVQMLTSIRKRARRLSNELQRTTVLVLFDEGHYEPAAVWNQVVRSFRCPRIIFTATPFRGDFKLFDVDLKHVYRYSFDRACRERYVRDVKLYPYSPVRSPALFMQQVLDAYNRFFGEPAEGDRERPRAIIRCDAPEEIRQLVAATRNLGRSAIGIHETFDEDPATGEYYKVPDPALVNATFWVHQFKLLEGIDDPRFQLLALYSELRSMRAFVQQVGRVIRNPRRMRGAIAHVLDHSRRARQSRLWGDFLEYDQCIERGDPAALDLNQRSLVSTLQKAVPGLLYVDGRLRRPADIAQLDLEALHLPLSANLFDKPPRFPLARAQELLVQQCDEDDLFYHAPPPRADAAVVFYVRVDPSPLLETRFFPEPKLGVSLVRECGRYLFVFDSHGSLAANAVRAVGAAPVGRSRLRKLFVRAPGTRLTHVSMLNANLGADQVRARAMTAVSVEEVAPAFDEHGYVLATATGYSRGRCGDEGEERNVRRYIGTGSGRASDLGAKFVPFDIWTQWTVELRRLLDGTHTTLAVFNRWASDAPVPIDPSPRSVLLDVSEVLNGYRTTGEADLPADQPMELSELCADVHNGKLWITANTKRCGVQIQFDPSRQKYELSSPELDQRYYSTVPENNEGLVRYLNRTQSLRVIPASPGYFYTLGQFCRPLITFGPDYDDAKMGVLSSLITIQELGRPMLEKGRRCREDQSGWERGCLFDLIDSLGRGTGLARHFEGTDVLVCDDLNDECADFMMVQRATGAHPKRAVFIHAKASLQRSECSASALQDVCGQAQKTLREVSLFADPGPSKRAKWDRAWNGRPHTEGLVGRRIRRRHRGSDPEEDIRRTVKDPAADREVWLMLGNLLLRDTLERLLRRETPAPYAIHTAYLLFSTITNTAAAGARLRVFCG